MARHVRTGVIVVCLVAIFGSLVAFVATGMRPYTRFRDEAIEQANAETDLSDLFSDTSDEAAEDAGVVESVNAIGLLPSGPGLASLSVATLSGPALVALGFLWWRGRRARAKVSATSESAPSA